MPDEESWPLALEPDAATPAAYRSVITCRVHCTVEVGGAAYVVLRIAGVAFSLHQAGCCDKRAPKDRACEMPLRC